MKCVIRRRVVKSFPLHSSDIMSHTHCLSVFGLFLIRRRGFLFRVIETKGRSRKCRLPYSSTIIHTKMTRINFPTPQANKRLGTFSASPCQGSCTFSRSSKHYLIAAVKGFCCLWQRAPNPTWPRSTLPHIPHISSVSQF